MFIGIGIGALGMLLGGGNYGLVPWLTNFGFFVFGGSILFLWNAAHCPKCKAFIGYAFSGHIDWKTKIFKNCSRCGVSFEKEIQL